MLLTEYVEGASIADFWDVQGTDPDVCNITVEQHQMLLKSAHVAHTKIHDKGVLHRNIHAGNIIFSPAYRSDDEKLAQSVVFIDFGDSHILGEDEGPVSKCTDPRKLQPLWSEVSDLTELVAFSCKSHKEIIKCWMLEGGPGIPCFYDIHSAEGYTVTAVPLGV
ncbi:hypothetical protein OF83DRAFT_1147289 [Amylostereum chailletii]|nr:hypothetical protein OF83DRAFT_1147289 [Amylostereum chailletii]